MPKEYMKDVVLQGIIYNSENKTILIGKRKDDPHIKEVSWTFIGGRTDIEHSLEDCLINKIKFKSGLDIEVNKIVFAKTYPERPGLLSIYYLCSVKGGKENPNDDIHELKWVNPGELDQYFTTSLHPWLFDYLKEVDSLMATVVTKN